MVAKKRAYAIVAVLLLSTLLVLLAPAEAQAQGRVYVVRWGDTLASIAWRHGTTVNAIMRANGLSNPNYIWAGQRLTIPGGTSTGGSSSGGGIYIVRRGDTLGSIAARYGTTVSALMSANGLSNPNFVWVGQRLRIPSGGGGGGSTPSGGGGSSSSGSTIHVVRRGETLGIIAARYGTSVSAIAAANGLSNPNFVWVGQRLRIPSGGGGGGTTPTSGGGAKWIDVDLSSQRLRAYQGNTLLRTMIVSTGIASYPTPPGRYTIYAKYPSTTMSGPGYYLPGVPHSMFFYRGYAIHGTYWHNNFGTPMSHGCVNLTQGDAAWLYSWAPLGTLVVIHW